jgi:hypothetical protein
VLGAWGETAFKDLKTMMPTIFPAAYHRQLMVLSALLMAAFTAQASAPKEAIVCTKEPRTAWVGEQKIRKMFNEGQYAKVFFKISKGNCYEFYAIGKDNSTTEAYYHPVTMAEVRFNRVTSDVRMTSKAPTQAATTPAATSTLP